MEARTNIKVDNPPQDIKGLNEAFSDIATRVKSKYPNKLILSILVNIEMGDMRITETNEVVS